MSCIQPASDLDSISHLQHGTPRQRDAFAALDSLCVMDILRAYSPVLAGTIPLDIDIASSDLDILCHVHDFPAFETCITDAFGHLPSFQIKSKTVNGLPSVIAKFTHAGFLVEIFGQARPVERQNGCRHLIVEARLLALGGAAARDAIRELKRAGLKTEPAFARYFNLDGDPYQTLLELSDLSETELKKTLRRYDPSQG